jgi:hypothetical protein
MHKHIIGASTALIISTGMAAAQSAGCADVNGYFAATSLISGSFTNLAFDEGETVTLTADSITSDGGFMHGPIGPGGGSGTGPGAFRFVDASYTPISGIFAYPFPSGPISEALVLPSGVIGLGWREDVGLGGFFTQFTNLSLTCANIPKFAFGADLAEITAAGQQRAVSKALGNNISGRFGLGGNNVATRNSVFFSTQNLPSDFRMDTSAWVALNSRAYFGGYEGHSVDLMLGADYMMNTDTLMGVLVGLGASNLEDTAGNDTQTDAVLVGAYGGYRFSGTTIVLDGYLAYAAVDYDTGTAKFESDRILAGVTLSGAYEVAAGTLSPRASLSGSSEDFPAGAVAVVGGTTQNALLEVGARMAWNKPLGNSSLLPFASLDVEYGRVEDIGGLSNDFVAPRLGLGLSGTVGNGQLAFAIDAGRTTSDVTDVGLTFSYDFTF